MRSSSPCSPRSRAALIALATASTVVAVATTAAPFAAARTPPVTASATPPGVAPATQTVDFAGRVSPKSTMAAPAAVGALTAVPSAAGASTGVVTVDPYALVAASWAANPAVAGVVVQVRTRTAGAWSPWQSLEASPDAPSTSSSQTGIAARAGTEPLWVGAGADGVEARLEASTGAAPVGLTVNLIDPGTSSAPAGTVTAQATSGPIGVITRAQWGADERVRLACDPGGPAYTGTPRVAVVHHTAGSNNYTQQDSAAIVRGIYAYHAQTLGWCDIGYNFLTDKYGQIYEGRFGGMDKPVWGAHVGDFNENTFGVAVLGDYTQVPADNTSLEGLSQVIAYKFGVAGTDPRGTATLTSAGAGFSQYGRGVQVTKPTIVGHNDLGYTADPGNISAKLPQIRDRVAQLIVQTPPHVQPVSAPAGTPNALLWQMNDTAGPGRPATTTVYGTSSSVPVTCDINGDKRDDIAVYDKGHWTMRSTFAGGPSNYSFDYGWLTGTPVCGDWNGDGVDGIGIYENGVWYLKNIAGPGRADYIIYYGFNGALPVVGDWNGDGTDTIGVYAPGGALWMLRNSNSAGPPDAGVFNYGWSTGAPVVGRWSGASRTGIGMFQNGTWMLRETSTPGQANRVFNYGASGYNPVVANVNGALGDGVGVINKIWY